MTTERAQLDMTISAMTPAAPPGVCPHRYMLVQGNHVVEIDDVVIEEGLANLYVNGLAWVRLMCTPYNLDELALGLLRSEGIIRRLDDVAGIAVAPNQRCMDILLHDQSRELPQGLIVTSGCGGGVTFGDERDISPLRSRLILSPTQVCALMQQLRGAAKLYQQARGVHTSALSNGEELLLVAEDIGRHNTIDRLWGKAMKQEIETAGRVLLTTGRVSSEMIRKAARMRVPIVITRTSPTSLSVELAAAWNVTVIGYARQDGFRVYTTPERVLSDPGGY